MRRRCFGELTDVAIVVPQVTAGLDNQRELSRFFMHMRKQCPVVLALCLKILLVAVPGFGETHPYDYVLDGRKKIPIPRTYIVSDVIMYLDDEIDLVVPPTTFIYHFLAGVDPNSHSVDVVREKPGGPGVKG